MKVLKHIILLVLLFAVKYIAAQNQLLIPPALTGTVFNLNIQTGNSTGLIPGHTIPTKGFNGNILGPTLVMNKGDLVTINVTNLLNETTTVHWHGFHVSPENDGNPHSPIEPLQTYTPSFTVMDKAGTRWYHPHLHERTAKQVAQGLAGMIIVHDAEETALNLPVTYGVDDIPLIIQTKSIDPVADTIRYPTPTVQNGTSFGNRDSILLVNATRNPFVSVPRQMVRFRVLNGSQQRVFQLGLSNNANFYQIACDDGLLNNRYTTNRVRLSPGERADIVVDFSGFTVGQSVTLMSYGSEIHNGIWGSLYPVLDPAGPPTNYNPNTMNGANFSVIQFNVIAQTANPILTIPTVLSSDVPLLAANATVTRNKYLLTSQGTPRIGKTDTANSASVFNIDVVDDSIQLNTTEIWVLHGDPKQYHSFHLHDMHFYILDRKDSNNVVTLPNGSENGRKDVLFVNPKETVRVISRFEDFTSDVPYVYHCHILVHEDKGMMKQFIVMDKIYVDKNYVGTETGSLNQPFNTFREAVAAAKDGSTIVFKSGLDHQETLPPLLITKRIRIQLLSGPVIIK